MRGALTLADSSRQVSPGSACKPGHYYESCTPAELASVAALITATCLVLCIHRRHVRALNTGKSLSLRRLLYTLLSFLPPAVALISLTAVVVPHVPARA